MINNSILIIPIHFYSNAYTQKEQICKDNKRKTGIYRWTNVVSGKNYIGSSVDLSIRFRYYLNTNFLKRQIDINNSKIYRALLKYGYSSFNLEVIEYCDPIILIEREQYYLDNLKPEYNILKVAGSSFRRKHSKKTIERMRIVHLYRKHSKAYPVIVINNKTSEIKLFPSIRQAAKFTGIYYSHLYKCLRKNKSYIEKEYYITRNLDVNNGN